MNKKKGILFWITGLSGSGKSTLAKRIFPYIKKKCGPSVYLDGDTMRKILELYDYSYRGRASNLKKFNRIVKLLTDQGINVVFSLIGLMNKPRAWNRKNIKKYVEIFIMSNVKKIISIDKKNIYKKNKNVVGVTIKPQFPKKPDIIINNTFDKSFKSLETELLMKIKKLLIKKRY
ncbi:adenylyl-sulfate kinase [Pelagibacterales bacterium SAG-MED47]|nr:adenylyl-sulfate kinase [Pelagibacterales bacterium SAG-MED47]